MSRRKGSAFGRVEDLFSLFAMTAVVTALVKGDEQARRYRALTPKQRERYDEMGRRLVKLRHEEYELRRARAILRNDPNGPWQVLDSVPLYQPPRSPLAVIDDVSSGFGNAIRLAMSDDA